MAKYKRKPPSRVRYERSHPTVSCRVTKGIYDRLRETKEREGKSFADILKIGLGILEAKAKKDEKAYSRGYKDGYHQAELRFKVTYRCNVCGELITVNTREARQAVKEYMQDHGWGHRACHEEG
jgi:hypothetical protein